MLFDRLDEPDLQLKIFKRKRRNCRSGGRWAGAGSGGLSCFLFSAFVLFSGIFLPKAGQHFCVQRLVQMNRLAKFMPNRHVSLADVFPFARREAELVKHALGAERQERLGRNGQILDCLHQHIHCRSGPLRILFHRLPRLLRLEIGICRRGGAHEFCQSCAQLHLVQQICLALKADFQVFQKQLVPVVQFVRSRHLAIKILADKHQRAVNQISVIAQKLLVVARAELLP